MATLTQAELGVIVEEAVGFVVPAGAPETLAKAVASLAEDAEACRAMGGRARALAEGRYFAVMASDDSYVPGGLEKVQAALLASGSPIGALLCQAVYLAEPGNPIGGRPVYGEAHAVLLRVSAAERARGIAIRRRHIARREL